MDDIITWLDSIILEIGNFNISWRNVISFTLLQLILFILYRRILKPILFYYFLTKRIDKERKNDILRRMFWIYIFFAIIGSIEILSLDFNILPGTSYKFMLSTIFTIVLLILIARLLDYIFNRVILDDYYKKREPKANNDSNTAETRAKPTSSVQLTAYLIILIWGINYFGLDFKIFPSIPTNDGDINFYLSNVLFGILIYLIARLLGWIITQIILFTYYKRKQVDVGTQFAINQLVKYIIYVLAFVSIISTFGIELTVLWGGAAALLVGVGLGLQQTFNDLVSGVILLFERSVEVGDVIEIDNIVGIVRKIGLRTSRVETRDSINMIVPNSKLIVNNMINWSHFDDKARFLLDVGVAYGSDTKKVRQLLIDVAKQSPYVLEYPTPSVMFTDFADSSLNFTLTFWSRNFMLIEAVKSDLRFEIDDAFRKNDIIIPFPQRDLWIKEVPTNLNREENN